MDNAIPRSWMRAFTRGLVSASSSANPEHRALAEHVCELLGRAGLLTVKAGQSST